MNSELEGRARRCMPRNSNRRSGFARWLSLGEYSGAKSAHRTAGQADTDVAPLRLC